jgi:hypothetical protein
MGKIETKMFFIYQGTFLGYMVPILFLMLHEEGGG